MADVTELLKLLTAAITLVTALIGLSKARRQTDCRKRKGRQRKR